MKDYKTYRLWTVSVVLMLAVLLIGGVAEMMAEPASVLSPKSDKDKETVRELWIENGDRKIYGVLSQPTGGNEGKHPIAIVSHGFNGTHHFAQDYFAPLAEMGYMTYAFDFPCGSVKSKSDPNTMNMSVLDEKSDLQAIVNYFREQPYVDRDRIVLIGESQGGLVSALTAASMPKKVSQLVLIYPALCIPDNWNARYPRVEDIPDTTRMWNVPLGRRYFEEVKPMKVFKTIKKYKRPVIIIQGDADRVVSMEDSKRAVKTYRDASLHVIPGAGHGFKLNERTEAIRMIRAFLSGRPASQTPPFAGTFDDDDHTCELIITSLADGQYDVKMSIYRLTNLDDGKGSISPDGTRLTFTATDANGQPITAAVTMEGNTATVTFTDSKWAYINNGDTFKYTRR